MTEPLQPITTTVAEFCKASGIGRTKVYKMIKAGKLDTVKLDKQRLIVVDSYRRLIHSLMSADVRPHPPRDDGYNYG